MLFCGLVAWKCHVCFFFLCEDVKKCPCVIYIYLYTCTHTFSCRPHSLLFARESLWGWHASTEPAGALRAPTVTRWSSRLAQPYHEPSHFSISISRNSDALGVVTWWWWWWRLWRRRAEPYVLEKRHDVVSYLNTNAPRPRKKRRSTRAAAECN